MSRKVSTREPVSKDVTPGTASSACLTESTMAFKSPSKTSVPYYEQLRKNLRECLEKKVELDHQLQNIHTAIYKLETSYLEGAPAGNIVRGFKNYIKGSATTTAAAAVRRKFNITDADRIFSRGYTGLSQKSTSGHNVSSIGSSTSSPSVRISGTSTRGGTVNRIGSGRGGSASAGSSNAYRSGKGTRGGYNKKKKKYHGAAKRASVSSLGGRKSGGRGNLQSTTLSGGKLANVDAAVKSFSATTSVSASNESFTNDEQDSVQPKESAINSKVTEEGEESGTVEYDEHTNTNESSRKGIVDEEDAEADDDEDGDDEDDDIGEEEDEEEDDDDGDEDELSNEGESDEYDDGAAVEGAREEESLPEQNKLKDDQSILNEPKTSGSYSVDETGMTRAFEGLNEVEDGDADADADADEDDVVEISPGNDLSSRNGQASSAVALITERDSDGRSLKRGKISLNRN